MDDPSSDGSWFVGLGIDDAAWDASTFAKSRDRFLEMDGAAECQAAIDLADEHIPQGGTLACDKGFDTADVVAELRERRISPHVA